MKPSRSRNPFQLAMDPPRTPRQEHSAARSLLLNSVGTLDTLESALEKMYAIIDLCEHKNIPARMAIQMCKDYVASAVPALAKRYSVTSMEIDTDVAAFKLPAWERPESHWSYQPRPKWNRFMGYTTSGPIWSRDT